MKRKPIIVELSERDVRLLLNALDKAPRDWRKDDRERAHRKLHAVLNGWGQACWVKR